MHPLPIVKYPTPTLKQRSRDASVDEILDPAMLKFIQGMEKAMHQADGVGIAAPQVGRNIRLALINTKEGPLIFFNPQIIRKSIRTITSEEGCLSVPGVYGEVKRYRSIVVRYTDVRGQAVVQKAQGMLARVFQHEIDHLNGYLFIDRCQRITQGSFSK